MTPPKQRRPRPWGAAHTWTGQAALGLYHAETLGTSVLYWGRSSCPLPLGKLGTVSAQWGTGERSVQAGDLLPQPEPPKHGHPLYVHNLLGAEYGSIGDTGQKAQVQYSPNGGDSWGLWTAALAFWLGHAPYLNLIRKWEWLPSPDCRLPGTVGCGQGTHSL